MHRATLLNLALLAALTGLPAGAALAAPAPVPLQQPASADETALADLLVSRLRDGRFVGADERNPDHGRAFLHLAATSSDPVIVAAALRGLSYTWRREGRESARRPAMNADYVKVVRARLADADGRVRLEALRAARLPLGGKKPDASILDAVLAMLTSKNEADQIAAIEALYNVRDFASPRAMPGPIKEKVIKAMLPLLDEKSPQLVAGALYAFAQSAYPAMPEAATIDARGLRLAKHPEPAVRAESLRVAVALAGKKADDRLLERLVTSLGDRSAYVRASAAELLAEVRYVPAVHALVNLIEDGARSTHKITGYRDLAGKPAVRRFRPESGGRVDVVALRAIDGLTHSIDPKFECTPRGRDQKQARQEAVDKVRVWYAANQAKVPKLKFAVPAAAPAASPDAAPAAPAPPAPATPALPKKQ